RCSCRASACRASDPRCSAAWCSRCSTWRSRRSSAPAGSRSVAMKSYRLHGMMQSYFTRKMTGYLEYKRIPYRLRRFYGMSEESVRARFPGGIPAMQTPDGEWMWDSTSMIHPLELRFPEPAVLPSGSAQRFLAYLIEDAADEWVYRAAVGSRWHFAENHA